jgi:hypothetical protein
VQPRFSLADARALVPALIEHGERIAGLRPDLADAQTALAVGRQPPGGIAEVKALEAHLQEAVDWFAGPLVSPGPHRVHGSPGCSTPGTGSPSSSPLCWLEGEQTLARGAGRPLAEARRIVAFTGAGMPTEGGIPDFRSPGGIWTRYNPSDFTFDRFVEDAELRPLSCGRGSDLVIPGADRGHGLLSTAGTCRAPRTAAGRRRRTAAR